MRSTWLVPVLATAGVLVGSVVGGRAQTVEILCDLTASAVCAVSGGQGVASGQAPNGGGGGAVRPAWTLPFAEWNDSL